jgi:hypothetical protein
MKLGPGFCRLLGRYALYGVLFQKRKGGDLVTDHVKAEEIFHRDLSRNHEYLPITGLQEFVSAAQKIILGEDSPALGDGRVCEFLYSRSFRTSTHAVLGLLASNSLGHRSRSSRCKFRIEIPDSTDTSDLPLRSKLAEPLPNLQQCRNPNQTVHAYLSKDKGPGFGGNGLYSLHCPSR